MLSPGPDIRFTDIRIYGAGTRGWGKWTVLCVTLSLPVPHSYNLLHIRVTIPVSGD